MKWGHFSKKNFIIKLSLTITILLFAQHAQPENLDKAEEKTLIEEAINYQENTSIFLSNNMDGKSRTCNTHTNATPTKETSYKKVLGCNLIYDCIKKISTNAITAKQIANAVVSGKLTIQQTKTLLNRLEEENPIVNKKFLDIMSGYRLAFALTRRVLDPKKITNDDVNIIINNMHENIWVAAKNLKEKHRLIWANLQTELDRLKSKTTFNSLKSIALEVKYRTLIKNVKKIEWNQRNRSITPEELHKRYKVYLSLLEAAKKLSGNEKLFHEDHIKSFENTVDVLKVVKTTAQIGSTVLAGLATIPCGGCGAGWMSGIQNNADRAAMDNYHGKLKSWEHYAGNVMVEGIAGKASASLGKMILIRGSLPLVTNSAVNVTKTLVTTEAINAAETAIIGCYYGNLDQQSCLNGIKASLQSSYTTVEGWGMRFGTHVVTQAIYNTKMGQEIVRAGTKRSEKKIKAIYAEKKAQDEANKHKKQRDQYKEKGKEKLAQIEHQKYINSLKEVKKQATIIKETLELELKEIDKESKKLLEDAHNAEIKFKSEAKKLREKAKGLPSDKKTQKEKLEELATKLDQKAHEESIRRLAIRQDQNIKKELTKKDLTRAQAFINIANKKINSKYITNQIKPSPGNTTTNNNISNKDNTESGVIVNDTKPSSSAPESPSNPRAPPESTQGNSSTPTPATPIITTQGTTATRAPTLAASTPASPPIASKITGTTTTPPSTPTASKITGTTTTHPAIEPGGFNPSQSFTARKQFGDKIYNDKRNQHRNAVKEKRKALKSAREHKEKRNQYRKDGNEKLADAEHQKYIDSLKKMREQVNIINQCIESKGIDNVPDFYRSHKDFRALSLDPGRTDQNQGRLEAMAGIELTHQGRVPQLVRYKGEELEFTDKDTGTIFYDVKTPPSHSTEQGKIKNAGSIAKELRKPVNGTAAKRNVILDITFLDEPNFNDLWNRLRSTLYPDDPSNPNGPKSKLTAEELARIFQVRLRNISPP